MKLQDTTIKMRRIVGAMVKLHFLELAYVSVLKRERVPLGEDGQVAVDGAREIC